VRAAVDARSGKLEAKGLTRSSRVPEGRGGAAEARWDVGGTGWLLEQEESVGVLGREIEGEGWAVPLRPSARSILGFLAANPTRVDLLIYCSANSAPALHNDAVAHIAHCIAPRRRSHVDDGRRVRCGKDAVTEAVNSPSAAASGQPPCR
jgi:hypothetical protein